MTRITIKEFDGLWYILQFIDGKEEQLGVSYNLTSALVLAHETTLPENIYVERED